MNSKKYIIFVLFSLIIGSPLFSQSSEINTYRGLQAYVDPFNVIQYEINVFQRVNKNIIRFGAYIERYKDNVICETGLTITYERVFNKHQRKLYTSFINQIIVENKYFVKEDLAVFFICGPALTYNLSEHFDIVTQLKVGGGWIREQEEHYQVKELLAFGIAYKF